MKTISFYLSEMQVYIVCFHPQILAMTIFQGRKFSKGKVPGIVMGT